jgi:hypothetical protein
VGGQGKWGHCPASCDRDIRPGTPGSVQPPAAPTVSVEGSQAQINDIRAVLPWVPTVGRGAKSAV